VWASVCKTSQFCSFIRVHYSPLAHICSSFYKLCFASWWSWCIRASWPLELQLAPKYRHLCRFPKGHMHAPDKGALCWSNWALLMLWSFISTPNLIRHSLGHPFVSYKYLPNCAFLLPYAACLDLLQLLPINTYKIGWGELFFSSWGG
jgi:hypothetical protein